MARDPWKLKAFQLADGLVADVYRATSSFPVEERFGLQTQVRRAAVSAAVNLVEGSARRTKRDYMHFINIASASAAETRYCLQLARRLEFMSASVADNLIPRYTEVLKVLEGLSSSLAALSGPEA